MNGLRIRSKVQGALLVVMGIGALIFAFGPEGPSGAVAMTIAVSLFAAELILGVVDGIRRTKRID